MTAPARPPLASRAEGPKLPATPTGSVYLVGVVTTVDPERGQLTLALRREVRLHLTGPPRVLQEVRPWRAVQVVTEGTVVRSLRCL